MNLYLRSKLKVDPLVSKIKKDLNKKAELRESSSYQDLLRFKYKLNQISQTWVETYIVGRGRKINRANKIDKNRKLGKTNKDR